MLEIEVIVPIFLCAYTQVHAQAVTGIHINYFNF